MAGGGRRAEAKILKLEHGDLKDVRVHPIGSF